MSGIKYAILGAIAGWVVFAAISCLYVIFSSKYRCREDLEDNSNVVVLGSLNHDAITPKNVVRRVINAVLGISTNDEQTNAKLLATNMAMKSKDEEVFVINLLSGKSFEEEFKRMEDIVRASKELKLIPNKPYDDNMADLKGKQAVVMVEKNRTSMADIQQLLESLRFGDVSVIGAIEV